MKNNFDKAGISGWSKREPLPGGGIRVITTDVALGEKTVQDTYPNAIRLLHKQDLHKQHNKPDNKLYEYDPMVYDKFIFFGNKDSRNYVKFLKKTRRRELGISLFLCNGNVGHDSLENPLVDLVYANDGSIKEIILRAENQFFNPTTGQQKTERSTNEQMAALFGTFKTFVNYLKSAESKVTGSKALGMILGRDVSFSTIYPKDSKDFSEDRKEMLIHLYGVAKTLAIKLVDPCLEESGFLDDEKAERLIEDSNLADCWTYDFLKHFFEHSPHLIDFVNSKDFHVIFEIAIERLQENIRVLKIIDRTAVCDLPNALVVNGFSKEGFHFKEEMVDQIERNLIGRKPKEGEAPWDEVISIQDHRFRISKQGDTIQVVCFLPNNEIKWQTTFPFMLQNVPQDIIAKMEDVDFDFREIQQKVPISIR